MNIVSIFTGDPSGSPLSGAASLAHPVSPLGQSATTSGSASPIPTRDSQISDISNISSSVNGLQQAAAAQTTSASDDEPLLDLPALAPMPAPQAPPAVPTDDHGQSNIVFSDSDSDGTLIR